VKHVRLILLALLCASLCIAVESAQAQQAAANGANGATAQRAQRNLLVGVVDLRTVLANHPIVADQIPALSQKLQMISIEFTKAQQEAQDQLNKLQQTYKVGSPEYDEQMASIRKELSDAQFKAEDAQQKIIMDRTQLLFRAYKDLQSAIQEVARQNGVLIVHSKVTIPPEANANVSEEFLTLQEADQNTIVWNRPECDITELVKAQLVAAVGAPKGGPADASPLGNLGAQAMNAAQTQPQPSAQPQQTVGAQNRVGAAAPRTATAPSVAPRR
jgi:Skp family chaperone for outer membrane proteins